MLSRMVLVFIYRFEYLKCYLRHDGVSVGFDGHVSPFRKGNTVQSTGNPIISATNRGLSWEVFPWRCVQCSPIITGMLHNASVLIAPFLRISAARDTGG